MSVFFQYDARIDSRDADPFGQCRPSALLGVLQEAATEAACALRVSREEMLAAYNAFWMLARIWYRLDRPIFWDDRVTVKTWHRGGKGAAMYRDFDLCVNGVPAGEAVSTWVLADLDTRKLLRLSKVMEFEGTTGEELCKDKLLTRVRLPEAMTLADRRVLHYSDADVNGHVNNARYADLVCDALHLETLGRGRFVSSLQVGFLNECRPGERVALFTGRDEGGFYVHGADDAEKSRFDAQLTLSALPGTGA